MADESGSGASAIPGVILGGLLLGGVLVFVFGSFPGTGGSDGPDISVEVPAPIAPGGG